MKIKEIEEQIDIILKDHITDEKTKKEIAKCLLQLTLRHGNDCAEEVDHWHDLREQENDWYY